MNKVFLIGNLTKDPEIKMTQTGKKIAKFALAIGDGKDANGNDLVQYFNMTAWDKQADLIENYVKKGHKLCVVGSLQNRSWDKGDGTKAYATDITVREIELLTSKSEAQRLSSIGGSDGQTKDYSPNSTSKPAEKPKKDEIEEDELPEIDVDSLNVQMPF
jgi:single-strand DNA-binding protein